MDRQLSEFQGKISALILASASPRRKEILELLGVPFEVIPAEGVDEDAVRGTAAEIARHLAERKAEAVFQRLRRQRLEGGILAVLGADTVVAVEEGGTEQVLGKPKDEDDARRMLRLLGGRSHSVWTGVAVSRPGQATRVAVEKSIVAFRALSEEDVDRYILTGEPLGKAGAYAIQGEGRLLIAGFSGCYYNIVGLPLVLSARLLDGIVPLPRCDCEHHPFQRGERGCRESTVDSPQSTVA